MKISGNIIDINSKRIFPGSLEMENGVITRISEDHTVSNDQYILPGFIDAHVHVESSMLVPSEFARLAVTHGTVSTVSDPHEIGNVLGVEGVEYMIQNGNSVNFKFYFGAPSCVPATPFETAGASIKPKDIEYLLSKDEIVYLAEMMNWPGVLFGDAEVMEKITIAQKLGKPVDGHAPGLKGEDARKYIAAGISTDHECFTAEEAQSKLDHGMKIIIREGSAAKNFEALIDLIDDNEDRIMFCSDDKHPDNLVEGHIDQLVRRSLAKGKDLFKVLKAACINPVLHYGLDVGILREGDPADFILVDNLDDFRIKATFIRGYQVAKDGESLIRTSRAEVINQFNISEISESDLQIKAESSEVRVIEALDGQLITPEGKGRILVEDGFAESNMEDDILKMAVVNRYDNNPPAIGFIRNFGLKKGAIASSVGHDSHNITVVGTDNASIARAVNLIIQQKGGVSLASPEQEIILPLPVAGLMSNEDGSKVAEMYSQIDRAAKSLGSKLESPFMTLSFMALLVIPDLKLSDKGLFDGKQFKFTSLFL